MKPLPKGWSAFRLSDVCCRIMDGTHFSPSSSSGPFKYLTSKNIRFGYISLANVSFISEDEHRSIYARCPVKLGDLLLTKDGANTGNAALNILKEEFSLLSSVAVLRAKPESSTNGFLLQTLLSQHGQTLMHSEMSGQAITRLTLEKIGALKFRFPPLSEQRKIANILSTWDEALEKLDALITAKDRRKQALMQQLLTGRKRFPAFGKRAWQKVRMNQVLERVFRPIEWSAEMSLSLISIRRRCGGLFRRPDLLGSEYKTQDLHELKAGDFLVSKRQVVHGAWAIVTPEFEGGHVSKEYSIFDNIAPEILYMPFLTWLAQTPRMIRLARVASTGIHIEKLIFDPDVFLRESIRIPADLAEQRQIAAILDTADQELTLLRTQRNALDQQKRGLMQRLLTGKTRVKP